MKTNKSRQLEYIPAGVVFEAVLDMADGLGIPAKTGDYDLLAAITADRVHITRVTYSRRDAPANAGHLEMMNGIKSKWRQRFLRPFYSLITGHQASEVKHPPEQREDRFKSSPFYRSLKDVPIGELSRAVEKLAAELKIPIRSEDYDLMAAIFDEKVKDQKAGEA